MSTAQRTAYQMAAENFELAHLASLPEWVPLNELTAARLLGFSVQKIRLMRREGTLPYVRLGERRIAFTVGDLRRYVESCAVRHTPPDGTRKPNKAA